MNGLQDLINKLEAIDNQPVEEGCGDMPPAPPVPQPEDKARMSVNISAEGDAIEDVLKLMTKVNPDMINQKDAVPMSLKPEMDGPMDKPMIAPLKMLPDLGDDDGDDLPPKHDKDHMIVKTLDKDGDLDHDMDDHKKENASVEDAEESVVKKMKLSPEMQEKVKNATEAELERMAFAFGGDSLRAGDELDMLRKAKAELQGKQDEAYENEPNEEYDDLDYILNTLAGGMNRPKGTHSNVSKGDNPMQKVAHHESEEKDLRSQIKEELAQKLAQYKGE